MWRQCWICGKRSNSFTPRRKPSRFFSSRSEQTENQISLLLGENPQQVIRHGRFDENLFPPDVPAGLPSALLERRPDIRAAEQNLIAANAEIGVAKAAYFPRLSLSGFLGGQSSQLSSLFSGPHNTWSFVPQVTQPIFTAGRIKSGVRLAEAQRDSALVQYERTIQTAFTEVSNSLIAHQRVRESRVEQEALVTAIEDRKRLAYVAIRRWCGYPAQCARRRSRSAPGGIGPETDHIERAAERSPAI